MLDEMINGNLTDQDDGRNKFIVATMINDGREDKDQDKAEDNQTVVRMVKGVRISSNGEQQDGKDKYIEVLVPSDDAIFQLKPTGISTAMGLELLVQKTAKYGDLVIDPEGNLNRTAAYFHLPVNPEQYEFGFLSVFLEDLNVGPVRVVRRDKKDINPKQVEALAIFGRFHLEEEYRLLTRISFGPEEEEVRVLARRAFVRNRLTRAEFESFFETLKQNRVDGDPSWANVASPYDE